jgi:ESS family glutamate:Na+ symporter
MKKSYTSNYLLERISGTSFDYMITAAISVISISLLADYWLPLMIVCIVGGVLTFWYAIVACRRIFRRRPWKTRWPSTACSREPFPPDCPVARG